MFYSQTFLARKGPLGTVWSAAHMQSRLKKSHYTSTNISATVDQIMFPEVPLALRMTSHLLLGVVRIYSKQVDILYDDCNTFGIRLRKAFASINLNLPEDARQAPVQAITLPDTYDLDALDLDDELNVDKVDNHLRNFEDITLVDHIPFGTEPYISISFDEDFMRYSSRPTEVPDSSAMPMDRNVSPPVVPNDEGFANPSIHDYSQETFLSHISGPEDPNAVLNDPGPSISKMHYPRTENSPEIIAEKEIQREAVPEISVNPHDFPSFGNDIDEPPASVDLVMNERVSPIPENNLIPERQTPQFQPNSAPQASADSLQENLLDNSHVSFAIQATPEVPKPKAGTRKRKWHFDGAPVLQNKLMKKALKDCRDLLRKKNKLPESALGTWKFEKRLRKDKIFSEPTITGLCSDLQDNLNKKSMSMKLVTPDIENVRSPNSANAAPEIPASPGEALPYCPSAEFETPFPNDFEEMENLRNAFSEDDRNTRPENIPSPVVTPSTRRDEVISPSPAQTFVSAPSLMTERDTSTVFSGERTGLEYTGLSDVPELNFEQEDDLFFLEADNITPSASQGIHGIDSLSVRTRAVAQYLQRQSPVSPSSEDLNGHLTLNKILRGKTRRLCARMFLETLVLKSNGLVEVAQEAPYGDITLTLTPALSKARI